MAKLFADSGDPDQTPRSAASELGLHCLPFTLLRVSRLQWVSYAERVTFIYHVFCFILAWYLCFSYNAITDMIELMMIVLASY